MVWIPDAESQTKLSDFYDVSDTTMESIEEPIADIVCNGNSNFACTVFIRPEELPPADILTKHVHVTTQQSLVDLQSITKRERLYIERLERSSALDALVEQGLAEIGEFKVAVHSRTAWDDQIIHDEKIRRLPRLVDYRFCTHTHSLQHLEALFLRRTSCHAMFSAPKIANALIKLGGNVAVMCDSDCEASFRKALGPLADRVKIPFSQEKKTCKHYKRSRSRECQLVTFADILVVSKASHFIRSKPSSVSEMVVFLSPVGKQTVEVGCLQSTLKKEDLEQFAIPIPSMFLDNEEAN